MNEGVRSPVLLDVLRKVSAAVFRFTPKSNTVKLQQLNILTHLHPQVVELIPNGSKVAVTNSNKLRYLDALAQYKLANNVRDETDSFLKGLNELIPDNLLSIFDEYELEVRSCLTRSQ